MARRKRSRSRPSARGFRLVVVGVIGLSLVLQAILFIASLPAARLVAFFSLAATLVIALAIVLKPLFDNRSKNHLLLRELDALNPTEFEQRVALLCQHLGWTHVRQLGGSGDEGVDVFATYQGKRYVIQCKKYKDIVQPERVRELLGTMQHHRAQGAILATTGRFGPGSVSFAKKHNLELWDGAVLGEKLRQAEERQDPAVRERAVSMRMRLLTALTIFSGITLLSTLFF